MSVSDGRKAYETRDGRKGRDLVAEANAGSREAAGRLLLLASRGDTEAKAYLREKRAGAAATSVDEHGDHS